MRGGRVPSGDEGDSPAVGSAGARRRAEAALRAVPRAPFLPPGVRRMAPMDRALPIGGVPGSTCSQPSTVRDMLELLDPRPGQRVLDVGSGSGWTTALLTWLTAPGGLVVGVDVDASLVERAREALERPQPDGARSGPPAHWQVHRADRGELGWPALAPFDRILVNADARGGVPPALLGQMGRGAILVGPVDGVMTRVVANGGRPRATAHGLYVFTPLQQ